MAIKIYKLDASIVFENTDANSGGLYTSNDIKMSFSRTNETFSFIINGVTNARNVAVSDIQKEDGSSIGQTFETALDYLGSIINFKPASGGSDADLAGFIDYNHDGNAITITANTWTDIPNNGQGAYSNSTYKPDGVTELMDVSTGYIDVSELSLGDSILIRNDYTVTPNTNNALVSFRYVLGSGNGEYTLEKNVSRLDSGSGVGYRFSLEPDLIYMGDTNTKDNAIKLQIKMTSAGTLQNAGSVIQVLKR